MKRARAIETFARRESEMTTKEQAWSLRYAEASAEAEERVATRRRETDVGAKRRHRDGHLGDGGHRGGARRAGVRSARHAEMAALSRARRTRPRRGQNAGEHAVAADILNIQLDDLRAQLGAARGGVGETRDSASRQSRVASASVSR